MENYQVLHLIGEGCFGKVFKGRRKYTGQAVAMKFITTRGKTEKDLKNLRQEISILKTLNHENIIRLIDAFETSSDFVVVTEFAHGELFEIFQDDKQLPESEIQKIAKQLVQALFYLHSNRVIHRDMKPQNILIGSNNVIKLCDFGFARAMSNKTVVLNSVKGTPLYMAPELVQEQPYNHTADLWSLGVILYELFVGTPPFYTNSLYSLINLIINETVKFPNGMSPDFKNFLQGLLQKNPQQRLSWPQLLHHPFVSDYEQPRVATPISTTPKNNQSDAFLNIIETFDVKKNGLSNLLVSSNEEFAFFLISLIESMSRRRRRRSAVITFLIHVLQIVSTNPSYRSHELVIILFNHQDEILSSLITIIETLVSAIGYEEEVEDSELSEILRLFGIFIRESPKQIDDLYHKFSPVGTQLLKCGNRKTYQSSLINCCKCFAVLSTSTVGSGSGSTQLFQLLMGLVIGGVSRLSRSALHALNGLSTKSINEIVALYSSQFCDAIIAHIPIATESSSEFVGVSPIKKSPRNKSSPNDLNSIDTSAIHLLYRLSRQCRLTSHSFFSTPSISGLPILLDLPGNPDIVTRCFSFEIMAAASLSTVSSSPDMLRLFVETALMNENPWIVAFGFKFIASVLSSKNFGELSTTPRRRASARLEESLSALLEFATSNICKWISEFSRSDGLKYPLDGLLTICNFVGSSACRRFLRPLLPGIRPIVCICSDTDGVPALAQCLASAIMSSSRDEISSSTITSMVKDVVVVLQALLENLDTPKKIFACDKLLETFNFLLSSSTMSVEQELVDSLASGPFITSLVSHSQDLKMCCSTIGLMLSFSGQAGLNASTNFVKSKGLIQLKKLFVWSPGTESSLTDCLGIISNVARSSADHYPVIDAELCPYDTLQILLEQSNSDDVIAKVCNTIGNMCRHNDFFYKRISRLIPGLISACSREDNGCKKFGSFAIGNTAFHSATLYPELAKAIPVLVVLLGDGDEKTRANAAGALGNLVRNSNVLIKDMVAKGAVEQLLFQISFTNSVVDSSAKIALFSLGNLAMHSASREMLTKLKCDRIAESIATKARSNRDNQTIKYCERLIQKLGNINK